MSRTKNAIINAFASMGAKVITIFINFITRTVFIYTLGVEYLGVSGVFSSILTMLSLAELGFAETITYKLYKPIANNDKTKVSELMNFYRKIYNIIGTIVLVIGIILIPFLDLLIDTNINIKENIVVIYLLYLINTSMSYFFVYKATLLQASQKKYIVSTVQTITTIIKAIINCIILVIFHNFILYLVIEIFSTVLYNIIISMITSRKYGQLMNNKEAHLSKREKKNIFRDVKAMFLYKISGVVLNGTDNIIISKMLGNTSVGLYSNYTMIINQVYSFILQIYSASTASIGNMAAVEKKEKQEKVFNNTIFLSFCIFCFCTTVLWVLINPFIKIWLGEQFVLDNTIVCCIVVNFYIMGMATPITNFRNANGLFVQGKYRPLVMTIINIISSIILAKFFGIAGVILGTIISRITTQFWYDPWILYKKIFKKSSKSFFYTYAKYVLITVFSCLVAKGLSEFIKINNSIMEFIIIAFIAIMIPIILIYIIFKKTDEFIFIISILKKGKERLLKRNGK